MEPNVELITYTPEPDYVVYLAARTCYSQDINYDIKYKKYNQEQIEKLLDQVKKSGHHSVFEHVSFTFAIKNVSRAFLAQVTRHRIGISLSVQSQRFVSMENTDTDEFVYGKYYDNSDMTKNLGDGIYERLYHDALSTYSQLLDLGYKKEEARLVLPNGIPTKMVITMNARELMHYFNLRCCKRTQFEHREVAYKMLKLVKRVAPIIFRDAGASCVQLGYCPEIKGCGSYPTLEQIKEVYNKHKGDNENE